MHEPTFFNPQLLCKNLKRGCFTAIFSCLIISHLVTHMNKSVPFGCLSHPVTQILLCAFIYLISCDASQAELLTFTPAGSWTALKVHRTRQAVGGFQLFLLEHLQENVGFSDSLDAVTGSRLFERADQVFGVFETDVGSQIQLSNLEEGVCLCMNAAACL